ncbi:unnamed protein product [Rotaria sp. Silwood2]|nr:unnamed protein product [Rotaria sp. Silwood2]CAF4187863.1 unnamed protein product [Rotaria sp. Silwood2]
MEHISIKINDLLDEILIIILEKLSNIEVLYSLIDINKRLNTIAHDSIFTSHLTLICFFNDFTDPLPDRFCLQILSEIHYKVKWLDLESISMKCILLVSNYPNLYELDLYGTDIKKAVS